MSGRQEGSRGLTPMGAEGRSQRWERANAKTSAALGREGGWDIRPEPSVTEGGLEGFGQGGHGGACHVSEAGDQRNPRKCASDRTAMEVR